MEIKRINKEEIIEKLEKLGYVGKAITYEELKKLCKKYGMGMEEIHFAQEILGITESNFRACKNRKTRVKILKNREKEFSEEEKKEIIEKLVSLGYAGRLIAYDELQNLYKEYGRGMKESFFVQEILGITNNNFGACKNRGTKVKILKNKEKAFTEKEKKEIIKQIKKLEYISKTITYEELQSLYNKYGNGVNEANFSKQILGLTDSNYKACKNKGQRVRIFKDKEKNFSEEERKEIIEEIVKLEYSGKAITYKELQNLYREYGKGKKEVDFVQDILGITYVNYINCKNKGQRVKILKDKEKKFTEEEKEEVIKRIKELGYTEKLITYVELQSLYERFGDGIKEIKFAKEILGITDSNYKNCKYRRTSVRILNNKDKKTTHEEKEEMIKKITERGYIGKSINYEELQKLCKEHGKGMNEADFAREILGINYDNYMNCKNKGTNLIVKDGLKYKKSREMKIFINTPRYYSKEEIDKICVEYDISIEDFITYVVIGSFHDTKDFVKVIQKNNRLWIGKVRTSKGFVNKYIEEIDSMCSRIAVSLCKKYRIGQEWQDYKQEILVYIIENMGEFEKNFEAGGETLKKLIRKKTIRYCEFKILEKLKIRKIMRVQRFTRMSRKGKDDKEFEVEYADDSINIEEEVEEKIKVHSKEIDENEMDKCINLLKVYIEKGMTREEAILKASQDMNIDSKKMLEYMQAYLVNRGKVKIGKSGKVYLGEEI